MKKVTILGSTGSIGVGALDVIAKNPDRFRVAALCAGRNISLIKKQIEKFHPKAVAVESKDEAFELRNSLSAKNKVKIFFGEEGMREVASFHAADIVVSAIAGAAGLLPTLAAIEAGKDIALANKETMVMAGSIVTRRAAAKRVNIIPIDSEHSAIFQCLEGGRRDDVLRLILTASGGPFLHLTKQQLKKVDLSATLRHPRWKMGRKVTIDSATMMNKGLEIIEAKWLFNMQWDRINVLVHPQSVIHSMVEFCDGSMLAQLAIPDMRIPIAYALTHPERICNDMEKLDLAGLKNLEFYIPDTKRFPCLEIARQAGICGGTAPAVLNAADEVAVTAFVQGKIRFIDLPGLIEKVLNVHKAVVNPSLSDILHADLWARQKTEKTIERMSS